MGKKNISLVWSDEAPTEEGWYWYRSTPNASERVLKPVAYNCGRLEMDGWAVGCFKGQWAGPITMQEPSE